MCGIWWNDNWNCCVDVDAVNYFSTNDHHHQRWYKIYISLLFFSFSIKCYFVRWRFFIFNNSQIESFCRHTYIGNTPVRNTSVIGRNLISKKINNRKLTMNISPEKKAEEMSVKTKSTTLINIIYFFFGFLSLLRLPPPTNRFSFFP